MSHSISLDHITLGVCYYPEHWPKTLWADDLNRMKGYGIEVIRIAEFAWSKFEPEENCFTYDFFDSFLDLAAKKGMKVIFGTPTATPPAWLTENYPEVLNAAVDGTLYHHGLRRHYNYNSPKYKELVTRLVTNLAMHYASHPAIIGWQIDNELNCECDVFYSEADHTAFRTYLKDKFITLEALNNALGTIFWNQTYTSWDQIHLTRPTTAGFVNPHLALEEKRFISKSAIAFCKLQSDILRRYIPASQFITTNGLFGHLDSHEMTDAALDFITFDSYPNFAFDTWTHPKEPGNLNDRNGSMNLARVRSISPCFGIMEQQSGAGGWDCRMKQPMPKPGQIRLWTYQSIAHGADYIGYFRWRTASCGTEIYWHGLNDYSNRPNRRLTELAQISNEVTKLSCLAGTNYEAGIAFIKDYDNEWDGEQDQWHGPLDTFSCDGWFKAATLTHTPMDYLYLRRDGENKTSLADLRKYRLLIYPHATILTEETASLLTEYVSSGGTLIMGARTGYKDLQGRCPMMPMPGFASDLCGVEVTDYTHLGPNDDDEYALWDGMQMEAPIFNDILKPIGNAIVLATFSGGYYTGAPALIRNCVGLGAAYYYGAGFSVQTATTFLTSLGFASPFDSIIDVPDNVELAIRGRDNHHYLFLLNYKGDNAGVILKKDMRNLLTGNMESAGILLMKPYDALILEFID